MMTWFLNVTRRGLMNIAVTGAAGNLDGHITRALDRTDHDSRVIARREPPVPSSTSTWPWRAGTTTPTADTALRGVDRPFLMSTPDLPKARVPRHRKAIIAAQRAGVGHVVFLSLHHAVPDSPFPFAAANADAEAALRASGPDWTVPALVMGRRTGACSRCAARRRTGPPRCASSGRSTGRPASTPTTPGSGRPMAAERSL